MRTLIVAIVIVSFVAMANGHGGRRSSCNRKSFWKLIFKKNNRISRETFENFVVGRTWLSIYNVVIGNVEELVEFVGKNKHRHTIGADGTDDHTMLSYLTPISSCFALHFIHELEDRRVCRHGGETYLRLNTLFDDGVHSMAGFSIMFTQDPTKYLITYTCIYAEQNQTCERTFAFIQIPDTRADPCDEVDLSAVPWLKVAYDLYSITGLKFGDPGVIYSWLGTECHFPDPPVVCNIP